MVQVMQNRISNPKCRPSVTKSIRLVILGILLGTLISGTGCQLTSDRGLVRGWADVNSLGTPAAFVDQMRTDDFRTAAPASVLHNVGTSEVPRDVSGTTPDTFQVFPMGEFDCEVTPTSYEIPMRDPDPCLQQTSHSVRQADRGWEDSQRLPIRPVYKAAGAWLF